MLFSRDIKGKIVLDPAASPKKIDISLEKRALFAMGIPFEIPACTLHGIYEFDGDRLTVRFPAELGGERPTVFDAPGDTLILTSLTKAPAGFEVFPQTVKVTVRGADGKPAAGATVSTYMHSRSNRDRTRTERKWEYSQPLGTGSDGTVRVKYEDLRFNSVVVRDVEGKRMAIGSVSPAGLAKGEASVVLKPECHVAGSIVCAEMKKLRKSIPWTNVYAMKDGRRVGSYMALDEKLEFLLPPGKYELNAYGGKVGRKIVSIIVPEGKTEMTLEPIALPVSKLVLLEGQPAPELRGVVGWKGQPVKLADLKGKYVLLDFWGYWCGPCVEAMPILIEMHEKFHDKGLVVIGIHLGPA